MASTYESPILLKKIKFEHGFNADIEQSALFMLSMLF